MRIRQGYLTGVSLFGVYVAGIVVAFRSVVHILHHLVLRLALEPGMQVVGIGCGSGWLSLPLAQAVGPTGAVPGIDVQARKLYQTEQYARWAGVHNVHFVLAKAGEGSLSQARIDRTVLVISGSTPREKL